MKNDSLQRASLHGEMRIDKRRGCKNADISSFLKGDIAHFTKRTSLPKLGLVKFDCISKITLNSIHWILFIEEACLLVNFDLNYDLCPEIKLIDERISNALTGPYIHFLKKPLCRLLAEIF